MRLATHGPAELSNSQQWVAKLALSGIGMMQIMFGLCLEKSRLSRRTLQHPFFNRFSRIFGASEQKRVFGSFHSRQHDRRRP
jgi:hypothetical protein